MILRIIFLLLFAISLPVLGASWTDGNQVIRAVIWKPGYHGFYVESSIFHDPNPSPCGSPSPLYLMDSSLSEKETDRLYSMMLTAVSTGKRLHVWVNGCQSGYPTFSGLQVNK